jgi:hypothetical protein
MRRSHWVALGAAGAAFLVFSPTFAHAAAFTAGDIVVYRVGSGVGALSTAAAAVFIDEYSPTGTLMQSIPMPTTGSGALTANGTSTAEGIISRSDDGRYIVLTGYRKDAGGTSPNSDTSVVTPRVVGRIDSLGVVDTSTGLTDAFSGANIRAVGSTNGTEFWMGGSLGLRYAGFGATTSTSLNTTGNFRQIAVVNNQLYATSGAANPGRSVFATSPALPTSGAPTFNGTFTTSSDTTIAWNQYFFADLNPSVAGNDTLYVANQGTSATNPSGIYKFVFNGTTWSAAGSAALTTASGVVGTVNGTSVTLFGVSGTSAANTLQALTDSSGTGNLSGSFTTIATAGANTSFRTVALSVPEPTSLAILMIGGGLLAARRRHA